MPFGSVPKIPSVRHSKSTSIADDINYDVVRAGSIKSTIFGGEGVFFAKLRGPGRVWIQSLPFSRLAGRNFAAAPQAGGRHAGEGSLVGGIGNLLDGDG